jgi:hypothetical protein
MVPNWAKSPFFIGLIQNGTHSILRCVYFQSEWFLVVGLVKDRVTGYDLD